MGDEVVVVVGDYSAKTEGSFLRGLEELSKKRRDEGALHSGCILWIQSYLTDKFGFTLKAAIAPVLDAVPSVFPKDLPERVRREESITATEEQVNFIKKLNEGLILPVGTGEILQIIEAGIEYEKLGEEK